VYPKNGVNIFPFDISGKNSWPLLLSSAASNFRRVLLLADPDLVSPFLGLLEDQGIPCRGSKGGWVFLSKGVVVLSIDEMMETIWNGKSANFDLVLGVDLAPPSEDFCSPRFRKRFGCDVLFLTHWGETVG
jgi:hypothetical protein